MVKAKGISSSPSPLLLLLLVCHPIILAYSKPFTYSNKNNTADSGQGGGDDRKAMGALTEAITGITPKNWDDFLDYCSWDGIKCDYRQLRVTSINLSSRNLTGVLPSKALNSLTYLNSLFLQNNNFYGALPCLANLPFLKVIDLSYNSFNAIIPNSFSNLTSLKNLSISNNPNLSPWGFPSELVDSKSLVTLSADYANINGPIPDFLASSFRSLQYLNLSHNDLTGAVPDALTSLPSLTKIDISYNRLSGTIPVFHAGVSVRYAGNNFEFNEKEAAGVKFKLVEVLSVIILPIAGLIALWIILHFVILTWCMKKEKDLSSSPKRFTYQELMTATNKFDNQMRLGHGGSSIVYRGILKNGVIVAVKRLQNSESSVNMFESEVTTLGHTRHRNVVEMIGYCSRGRHKLIVYEYMEKGSLDKWIFGDNREQYLTWEQKKKIIKQIAKGLQYLQQECLPEGRIILHRDIKPQNVLLDARFNAKVSDFGLAKILSNDGTTTISQCRGTLGYIAPEVFRGMVSEKADVYSYGVLVLETVFEDKFWKESDHNPALVDKVKSKLQAGQVIELIDHMGESMLEFESEIEKIAKLALWCLNYERLADRPSMAEVVQVLEGTATISEDKIDYSTTE